MVANMSELQRSVGRIEGKIDAFIEQMRVQDDRATKLDGRVRKVEGRINWATGAGAVFGSVIGALVASFKGHT